MQMAGRFARLRTGSMRTLERNELQSALRQARQYTRALVDDLDDEQWRVPRLACVNPMLWEVGHVGWFHGVLVLALARQVARARELQCSSTPTAGTTRPVSLTTRAGTLTCRRVTSTLHYLDDVLDATLDRLEHADDPSLYFFQLALYHEDMHGEAFAYTRQTCAYPAPLALRAPARRGARRCPRCGRDVRARRAAGQRRLRLRQREVGPSGHGRSASRCAGRP